MDDMDLIFESLAISLFTFAAALVTSVVVTLAIPPREGLVALLKRPAMKMVVLLAALFVAYVGSLIWTVRSGPQGGVDAQQVSSIVRTAMADSARPSFAQCGLRSTTTVPMQAFAAPRDDDKVPEPVVEPDMAWQLTTLINSSRADRSVPQLQPDNDLAAIGVTLARHMVVIDKLAFSLDDGRNFKKLLDDVGVLSGYSADMSAWNTWRRDESVATAHKMLVADPGTSALLNAVYRCVGVGAARSKNGRYFFAVILTDGGITPTTDPFAK